MFQTYRPSGRFGIMALPLTLVGMVVCVGIAYLYQLLLELIPFIYLNFLMTAGVGIAIAFVGGFIVHMGHVRNPVLGLLIGLALMLSLLGGKFRFQYCRTFEEVVTATMEENGFPEGARQETRKILAPQYTFTDHLRDRVDVGWAIGRGNNGAPVGGFLVYLVWLIEAGVLFYLGSLRVADVAREPYSEKTGQWADKEEYVMTLPVTGQDMVARISSATSVDELLELPIPETDLSMANAIYRVNSIRGQELEDAYLSVDLITITEKKGGEKDQKIEHLVRHAILTSEQRKRLLENAGLLQEAMIDYRKALMEEQGIGEIAADDDGDNNGQE